MIAQRCTESEAGVRNIESILSHTRLADLSSEILARLASGSPIETVPVGVGAGSGFTCAVS